MYDSDVSEPDDARAMARKHNYDFDSFQKHRSEFARGVKQREKENNKKRNLTGSNGDGLAVCLLLKTLVKRLALVQEEEWNSLVDSRAFVDGQLPGAALDDLCTELKRMNVELKHKSQDDRVFVSSAELRF